VKKARVILVALCVTFILGSTGAANGKTQADWVTNGLLCIHSHEGAWNANTGNGYYGGLQMDSSFQRAYGYTYLNGSRINFMTLWGYAHNWPVWAQLQAGKNGYKDRGWRPWPNTARMCGLM